MGTLLTEKQLHRRIMSGKATRSQIVRGIHLRLDRRRTQEALQSEADSRGSAVRITCTNQWHEHEAVCFAAISSVDDLQGR